MTRITIQQQIELPIEQTWRYYFEPEHIVQWNQASTDWHCPSAESDLWPGGRFCHRLEAKDGRFGFDFWGTFDEVDAPTHVAYTLGDGRKADVNFEAEGPYRTKIRIRFEAESQNSREQQQAGWQTILDNFKKYAESTASFTANKIAPSLWFKDNAREAMEFYVRVFGKHFSETEWKELSETVVTARLAGMDFIGINGGETHFAPNPSVSFMVVCESRETVDDLWVAFSDGGQVYMELGNYPWSEHYGWIGDRYGFTWQLYLGKLDDVRQQTILPTLMFTQAQDGRCAEAVDYYASIFPEFQSDGVLMHHDESMKGKVAHTQFVIGGTVFAAMDGGPAHQFAFNEAISFTIFCQDQAEIDYYWKKFTEKGKEGRCGWCEDPFGVHWQLVPRDINRITGIGSIMI